MNSIVFAIRYKQAMQNVRAAYQAIANQGDPMLKISPAILVHDNMTPDANAQPRYSRRMCTYLVRRIFRMTGVPRAVRIAREVPTNPDAIAPNDTVAPSSSAGVLLRSKRNSQHRHAASPAHANGCHRSIASVHLSGIIAHRHRSAMNSRSVCLIIFSSPGETPRKGLAGISPQGMGKEPSRVL